MSARRSLAFLHACLVVLWLEASGAHVQAADATPSAGVPALLATTHLRPGLCCLPRAGDGSLALELAQAGIPQVLELAADQAAVGQLRARISDAHALEQVVADRGSPLRLPLSNGVCDLLAIADLAPADLTPAQAQEITRVLAPYRGIAIVGNPAGGLDAAQLAAWAKTISPTATVTVVGGMWAVARMSALAGADDWTHMNHAADGNPVSNDATIGRGPDHLQWYGGPYSGDKWGTYVAGGGRVFWSRTDFGDNGGPSVVMARALSDGHVLWKRPIALDFGRNDSLLIADGESLWLEDEEGVLLLDAETGAVERRIVVTSTDKEVRWMLLSDGVLVTLAGPHVDYDFKGAKSRTESEEINFIGDELTGWSAADGHRLWTFAEQKIDPPKLVANGGRLYLYAARQYAAALDIHSGALLWKTAAPIAEPSNPGMGWWWDMNDFFTPTIGAIATKDAYIINWRAHLQSQAFAASDGKLLWDHMHGKESSDNEQTKMRVKSVGGMLPFWMVIDGIVYTHGNFAYHLDGPPTFDALTGKGTPMKFRFQYGGCGHFTADSNGLFFGMLGEIYDNTAAKLLQSAYSKTACGVSQFVADGDIIKVPSPCPSCMEWRGFIVTQPGTAVVAEEPATRLEHGAATAVAAAQPADGMDWTTYRANETRSNALPVSMPSKAAVQWIYQPTGLPAKPVIDECPTPVIAVAERAFMGTADGVVVCIGTSDGKEIWRFATAGRIWSAPSWSAGRIYVGSADGWLYCLSAEDGTLIWRYRVAPVDSRILQWGRLSSRWPVLPCALVHDGVVYSLAGVIGEIDGTEMVALDAATGALRWQQHWGGGKPDASGQMCWGDGAIWLRAGDWGNARVDPATGAFTQVTTKSGIGRPNHGQDIGFLGNGWLIYSGRQHILPPRNISQDRMYCTYQLAEPAAGQNASVITIPTAESDGIGAWDAHGIMFGTEFGHWWIDAGLLADLDASASSALSSKMPIHDLAQTEAQKARALALPVHGAHEASRELTYLWPMLTTNDVVMTGGDHPGWGLRSSVVAIDRVSGKIAWSVPLVKMSTDPVWNGMCLDRDGQVLVPLQDGSLVCIGAPKS